MKHIRLLAITLQILLFFRTDTVQANTLPAIIINEVQISGGIGHTNDDFIELYNTTDTAIDVNGWQLRKKTKSDTTPTGSSLKSFSADTGMIISIPAKGYLLWANSNGAFKQSTNAQFSNTSTLTDDNSVALFDTGNTLIDAVTWGSGHTNPFVPTLPYPTNPTANTSIERDTVSNAFLAQIHPTPQNTAIIQTKPALPPIATLPIPTPPQPPTAETGVTNLTPTTIRINEVLPNPSDTNEFIELFNFGETDINLKSWSLHDASKTGAYTLKDTTIIKAQSYLTLFRDTFSFALNNTEETITLFDPNGTSIDTLRYAKSNKDASYNFSPSGWRWSNTITPDALNQFGAPPTSKTTVPKNAYQNVPVEFIANNTDEIDGLKYVWDFGDGHTSRLESVKHTYAKTGTYTITLTLSDSVEETVKTFVLEVKKLPKMKLSITGINPNPAGADTDREWITIKNNGDKKVDLFNWGIATGTSAKTLANHPVQKSLIIKPKKEITLGNDIAAFSLPNKEGFIELRQPNKKAVDTLHYTKESGDIKEDETYQRSADASWKWLQTDTDTSTTDNTDSQALSENSAQDTTVTTDAIASVLDTLSVDELTLLKTRIEKKLEIALAAKTTSSPETGVPQAPLFETNGASNQTPLSNDTSYHKQSLETIEQEKITSIINHSIPSQETITHISNNSLLAKEPLAPHASVSRSTNLLHHINQTAGSLLKEF